MFISILRHVGPVIEACPNPDAPLVPLRVPHAWKGLWHLFWHSSSSSDSVTSSAPFEFEVGNYSSLVDSDQQQQQQQQQEQQYNFYVSVFLWTCWFCISFVVFSTWTAVERQRRRMPAVYLQHCQKLSHKSTTRSLTLKHPNSPQEQEQEQEADKNNKNSKMSVKSSSSSSQSSASSKKKLSPATLVYHESARSIVFRDQVRRVSRQLSGLPDPCVDSATQPKDSVVITGFTPAIDPFEALELSSADMFEPLVVKDGIAPQEGCQDVNDREAAVLELLRTEQAVVKTIRNADWTTFLERLGQKESSEGAEDTDLRVPLRTSTSLLPSMGKKMRCYGSTREFSVGAIFALPTYTTPSAEDQATRDHKVWCWPSGYSAKTEFNIDHRGRLINGRQEALVTMTTLRQQNHAYLHDTDYIVGGRMVKGGLNAVPYNEVYVRVGGHAEETKEGIPANRTYEGGVGMPIALFVRTATYAHLVSLLRTRARLLTVVGADIPTLAQIPLLVITPEHGAQVVTQTLQAQLYKRLAENVNPFQNPQLYKTELENSDPKQMRQKLEELIDLNDNGIRTQLTMEERARLAGGFGATDDSVAQLLMDAMQKDQVYKERMRVEGREEGDEDGDGDGDAVGNGKQQQEEVDAQERGELQGEEHQGHELQHIVNEGLVSAVRSSDYNTARQLLILYTLVASRGGPASSSTPGEEKKETSSAETDSNGKSKDSSSTAASHEDNGGHPEPFPSDEDHVQNQNTNQATNGSNHNHNNKSPVPVTPPAVVDSNGVVSDPQSVIATPPPPPLDTDRLRSATNSDGLLAVLGAAEVLKAMQNGSAKKRVGEAVGAIEEWVANGENSVTFRLASWMDQRQAQDNLKIAMEKDSAFTAFVGTHAISNRKKFATQLRASVDDTHFESMAFLRCIHGIAMQMHSPCLRLELLQYILGLDNRYSVAHVARSVELAATCLNITQQQQGVVQHLGDGSSVASDGSVGEGGRLLQIDKQHSFGSSSESSF